MEPPPSYTAAAARADKPPVAVDPGVETLEEMALTAEERTEMVQRKVGAEAVLVFRPPPAPPPWSKFFSTQTCAMYRVFCWKQRNLHRQMF